MILVVVESPAKAKKIEKILGEGYIVRASIGHVRDMPSGEIAVDVKNNFKPTYVISNDKKKVIADLKRLAQSASQVILATDDDREGEAIAWHLIQVLNIPLSSPRAKFHEITKKEILNVMSNKLEQLDIKMVDAQQARRIIDRLVGYEISPILWRKLKGATSAGRVQSAVTKIIVDREKDILEFVSSSKYKIRAFCSKDEIDFIANFEKDFADKLSANTLLEFYATNGITLTVDSVSKKPVYRTAPIPFTTSTFQQAASIELKLTPKKAMAYAQQLYMGGFITYMRTDSPTLSEEAIKETGAVIKETFGLEYLNRRQFKAKDGSAQEAHEAIRPTCIANATINIDDNIAQKVYDLIRNRVLASQMADAKLNQTTISFKTQDAYKHPLITKGEVVEFDGFMKIMKSKIKDNLLPRFQEGDSNTPSKIIATETWKKPRSRYDEANLIKKLEELGIGRPSTFATMVDVVQRREYAVKGSPKGVSVEVITLTLESGKVAESLKQQSIGADKNKLIPTDSAYALIDFMSEYFADIIDYNFTADLEKEFDRIAAGEIGWTDVMRQFYNDFHIKVENAQTLAKDQIQDQKDVIGVCPKTSLNIIRGKGKYGYYIRLDTKKAEIKSVPKHINPQDIDLETALVLLSLPRALGQFKDNDIVAAYGKNGGYLKCGGVYINLQNGEPESITQEQAIQKYEDRDTELKSAPKCKACKSPLIAEDGKWGKWWRCTGYPKCKHKQKLKPPV